MVATISRRTRADAQKSARMLRLVANPARLLILGILGGRGAHVGDIAEALGLSQSATSHQLGILTAAGVVAAKKEGRSVRYTLGSAAEAKRIMRILRVLDA